MKLQHALFSGACDNVFQRFGTMSDAMTHGTISQLKMPPTSQ
jgi:hypothetical protein